jgi:hypothetical protein
MKNLFLLLIALISINTIKAQDFDNDYQPLQSKGEIPKAILTTSAEKYENDKAKIDRSEKRKTRKDKDKFFLQNNFVIDEMMRSGKVLFNDPLSLYVNKVADKLLATNPELRSKLNFYVIKSAAVNAFATDRGTIFINTGLIARLEDEAQLAYILAHEIVHYEAQHNIQTFIEYAKIERQNGYSRSKSYERLLEKNNYSKLLEKEADKNGLEFFLESKYKTNTLRGVFDILGKSHVPYTNVVFDMKFLETPNIQFPNRYQLKEIKEIIVEEDQDEEEKSESTHPSVKERRSDLLQAISGRKYEDKSLYLVSETEFKSVRETARFEICQILLQSQRYTSAIYHTYALLQTYPNNQFLRKTLAKSLYGLAQYKNVDRYDEVMPLRYENYQGEIQQAFHLFEKMEATELNVLAAVYCWKVHQEIPESKGLELMAKDMIEDLVIYQVEKPSDFFRKERPDDLSVNDVSFDKFGFGKLTDNKTIQEWLANGEKYRKKFEADKTYYESRKGKKAREKKYKKEARNGKSLGLNKVVYVNPTYINIDERKDTPYQYIKIEERRAEFENWITENGKKLDLKTKILDVNNLSKKATAEDYQNIVVMNDWFDEILTHDMYMINSNYDEAIAIADKYGTDHFVYSGAISYRNKFYFTTKLVASAYLMIWPPTAGKFILSSNYEALHFSLVFNVRQNERTMTSSNFANYKDKDLIIQQNLYWSMLQMKRKPKK